MPELPEVETVRRSLLPIVGCRIEGVDVWEPRLRRRLATDFAARVAGRRIEAIERRAKYLLFRLDDGGWMLAHLGMSGALLLRGAETRRTTHDHVRLRLAGGLQLTLNDPRRFGLLRAGMIEDFTELGNVGPDPLDAAFTLADFSALTRGRRKPVKNVLMDQRALGGVGNIYANEILFRAGVRPGRAAGRLTRAQVAAVFEATKAVLREAVELGGSSISDYRDATGRPGYFQLRLAVYDRAGEPCPRCATRVQRTVQAGRSSFYCPACQR